MFEGYDKISKTFKDLNCTVLKFVHFSLDGCFFFGVGGGGVVAPKAFLKIQYQSGVVFTPFFAKFQFWD